MTKSTTRKRTPPRRRNRANSVDAKIQQAISLQKAGELDRAKELYCNVLSTHPEHGDAWHFLGMALYSAAAYPNALECLQNARTLLGDRADLMSNLSLIYRAMGDFDQAKEVLSRVIASDPNNVGARNNLGVLLLEHGRIDKAEKQFKRILQIDERAEQAEMNLANCWLKQNRLRDAEQLYRKLIARDEANLSAYGNLGECLRRQCKWEESLEVLELVAERCPKDLVSQLTLSRTLANLGRYPEAARRLEKLIAEQPDYAKAHHYLGTIALALGDLPKAESEVRQALNIDPNDAHAFCSLGQIYNESEQRDYAIECFTRALELDPTQSESHSCLLYFMCGDPSMSPAALQQEHERWAEKYCSVQSVEYHNNCKDPNRRLRIGYASGDFREHPAAIFFEPLLRLCDGGNFETFCYSESGLRDDVTAKLKSMSDHWRETLGYSDQQVAKQIMDDEIDILVDLAGHTTGNRLTALAYKPAPIQISWLGYPNTTGMKAIDFCLTCEIQNPLDEPSYHSEQLIRIPGGSFSYAPPENAPAISELPAKRNGHITFGSLHRPFKISTSTHDLWAAAMKACPDARLLAFHTRFSDCLKAELTDALVERGIDAERIEVRSDFSGDSFLEVYNEIDIGLDATPWAGGTTTMGALWMGVPVIGFFGNSRPSRGTAGIVHHLGKPEWIARDIDDYASKVGKLAAEIDELERLRQSLRGITSSSVANEQRFVTELEKAYRSVWKNWCDT